jgi:3-hydroxyisobutyrate dehydrogenase-like beta-hydroxyacid dehydrogenase
MVLFETVAALSEACAIARHAGVDPMVLFDALSKGSADSFALRSHGMKSILPRQFPARAFSVEYAKKDLAYALDMAQQGAIDARGAGNVARLFEQAIAEGWGDQYFPVISRLLDRNA